MNKRHLRVATSIFSFSAMAGLAAFQSSVYAGPILKIDDTKWISVGAGLRTSFSSVENAAPNGSDRSKDFSVENIRLYLNGQVHKNIKLTFNTERDAANNEAARVLDAIARFEFSDTFNIWAGRFLPPSDRSNLNGPFYLNTWSFPLVQNYPALFAGRDNGVAAWGFAGSQFKYQFGAFDGRKGGSNVSDSLLYTGRLTYNFWDPEPGYYNSSAYYGAKDILALGVAAMHQKDGAGTSASSKGDFTGWNVDALMEKKLANNGVVSLEGAYYDYDLGNVADAALVQGNGYFVLAGYLFPQKVGIGQLQPHVRYQSLDPQGSSNTRTRTEVGLNYIIDGHDAKASLIFAEDDPGTPGSKSANSILLGMQIQL